MAYAIVDIELKSQLQRCEMFDILNCAQCGHQWVHNKDTSNSPSCKEYRKLRSDVDDLLNIIHRDNGEYTKEHGYEKSCDDAGAKILETQKQRDKND